MFTIQPYIPLVVQSPINASLFQPWDSEANSFVRVNLKTYALMLGLASRVLQPGNFAGTEQEILIALDAMNNQVSEVILTKSDICDDEPAVIGALFRGVPNGEGEIILQAMESEEGLPPPWEYRVIDVGGEQIWQYRTKVE